MNLKIHIWSNSLDSSVGQTAGRTDRQKDGLTDGHTYGQKEKEEGNRFGKIYSYKAANINNSLKNLEN